MAVSDLNPPQMMPVQALLSLAPGFSCPRIKANRVFHLFYFLNPNPFVSCLCMEFQSMGRIPKAGVGEGKEGHSRENGRLVPKPLTSPRYLSNPSHLLLW
jgi:hypothetical protein